jgi:hypothetical protein
MPVLDACTLALCAARVPALTNLVGGQLHSDRPFMLYLELLCIQKIKNMLQKQTSFLN